MKKMKAKEFKEALNKAGFYMDIYGYEGILNMIAAQLYDDAHEQEHISICLADRSRKQARILHDILEERGYYND
jgi:hypothetical protein